MRAALIVIDAQHGIDESEWWGGNRNNLSAEQNIVRLIAAWRQRSLPVVLVQHHSINPDSPFHPSKAGATLKREVSPAPTDLIITKSTANAFINTPLRDEMVQRGIDRLIVTGFVTNNSVESTVRFAAETGFDVTVIEDATAAFDKEAVNGTLYPAETVHRLSLANLRGEYASIRSTAEILFELDSFFLKNTLHETLAKG